jgi:hypothetical protein
MIYFSMNVLWPEEIAELYTTDPVDAGWLAVSFFFFFFCLYRNYHVIKGPANYQHY